MCLCVIVCVCVMCVCDRVCVSVMHGKVKRYESSSIVIYSHIENSVSRWLMSFLYSIPSSIRLNSSLIRYLYSIDIGRLLS
jgi:hypothetical protein